MDKLTIDNREDWRNWLMQNAATAKECWLCLKRGKPREDGNFWYLDAVEEALCFGWIDSTQRAVDGVQWQRFSPRAKGGLWTELNKARVRRLERLGLMTDLGRAVLPPMDIDQFVPDRDVVAALEDAGVWDKFLSFPPLYRRIRLYNAAFYKTRDEAAYQKALSHLIDSTRKGELYGAWDDYGRLSEED